MKVFIVTHMDYENSETVAVFTDRAKADAWVAAQPPHTHVVEDTPVEVDPCSGTASTTSSPPSKR